MALRYQNDASRRASPGQLLLVVLEWSFCEITLTETGLIADDFEARSSDELSLCKGDRIELIERDDDFGDGWYLGKHVVTGHIGLFPEVYTTVLPGSRPVSNVSSPTYQASGGSQSHLSSPSQNSFANTGEMEPQVSAADKTPQVIEGSGTPRYFDWRSSGPPPLGPLPPVPTDAPKVGLNVSGITPATAGTPTKSMGLNRLSRRPNGEDSPVMNETLSVINEHITDLNTPRQSLSAAERQGMNDSGSEYSNHMEQRGSYITGDETDEEDQEGLTETEVCTWTPLQVAEHLGERGVRAYHCKWFAEQEINGEVLLKMDLASLLTKEFDLGVSGHRLHTWQIIQSLQQEAKNGKAPQPARSSYNTDNATLNTPPSSRTSATGGVLPRIPTLMEEQGAGQMARQQEQQFRPNVPAKPEALSHSRQSSYISGAGQGGPRRPSAASIREFNHSRRHSSIDVAAPPLPPINDHKPYLPSSLTSRVTPHKKQESFDRSWTMGAATSKLHGGPSTSSGIQSSLSSPDRSRAGDQSPRVSSHANMTPNDLDRGYFSGGELENRKTRNVLRKREGGGHSRNSSYVDAQASPTTASSYRRHSRFSSADSIRTPFSSQSTVPKPLSPAAQAYYGIASKDRFPRSTINTMVSPIPPPKDYPSPTVTKLGSDAGSKSMVLPVIHSGSPEALRHQWDAALMKSKAPGSRAVSDAVTGHEKAVVGSPMNAVPSPVKESPLQSPTLTTSSTPSGSKSIEPDSPDPSRVSTGMTSSAATNGNAKRKSKKETSAYTRGLERKTPQEQMIGCDYSGWMKKKSTNLMTIWKSRLFVLRGRRLSYYYSENDERERGLIDISSHRVLPANNERLTGLHATLTLATRAPTSPQNAQTPTMASEEAAAQSRLNKAGSGGDSMFIFKLVPPRAGLSRAVNFTKPTVHYFAVDNIQQGRLWMAALMKATIGRDESKPITTSYLHKTISLARARQLRHRPPALMSGGDDPADDNDDGDTIRSSPSAASGLNIQGLSNGDTNQSSAGKEKDAEVNAETAVATTTQAHVHDDTETINAGT
ncbi:MAG: polar growth protein [Peltula sp. TS41687]|nr:MAG: polar growth protein [Peltula sp. TS41687]